MSNKLKMPTLKNSERELVLKYIEYSKMHDYSECSESTVLNMARELGIPAALRSLVLTKLSIAEIFSIEMNHRSTAAVVKIHPQFYDEACFYYLDQHEEIIENISASDRFVSISDNQPILVRSKEVLSELAEAIIQANQLTAYPEDKIQISKEISYIKDLISQPRIQVSALWDRTKNNSILVWLSQQTMSVVVREAAEKVIGALGNLLKHVLSQIN